MIEREKMSFKSALMDQAEYLDRLISNQQIQCVLTFEGRLDESRLARALRLVMDAEPVLGCRLVERSGRPLWQRRDDLDRLNLCTVEECRDEVEVAARMKAFLTDSCDPGIDPLVRLRVLRGGNDTLCVKLDHVATDTGGARECIYLVLEVYRRLVEDPAFVPAANAGGRRGLGQVLERFSLKERAKALKSGMPPGVVWGFPWRGSSHEDREFGFLKFSPTRFRALREYGRERGATVNDVVLAAYYRAMMEMVDAANGLPYCIQVPIDLRRYMPGGKAGAVCNLSGQLYTTLERVPGEKFEDTLSRVSVEMKAQKEGAPGVGTAMVVAAFTSPGLYLTRRVYSRMVAGEIRSGRCNPYLSNLGVLEPDRLELPGLTVTDAYLVSPLMFRPGFLVGVSTFRDAMTVTVGYSDSRANGPVVRRFLDILGMNLAAAAG